MANSIGQSYYSSSLRWSIYDAMWTLLRVFRTNDHVVCGALYGPSPPDPRCPPRADFRDDLLVEYPPSIDSDFTWMYDRYTCPTPAVCTGPMDHRCFLQDHVDLPRALSPLLEVEMVDTDLLINSILRGLVSPTITRWFSKTPSDTGSGSQGTALGLEWDGMRALLFPPISSIVSSLSHLGKNIDGVLQRASPPFLLSSGHRTFGCPQTRHIHSVPHLWYTSDHCSTLQTAIWRSPFGLYPVSRGVDTYCGYSTRKGGLYHPGHAFPLALAVGKEGVCRRFSALPHGRL
jgi:hypothetical protein